MPSVPRIYLLSVRALAAAQGAIQAVFDGVWLGVLSPEQLHGIDDVYYRRERLYVRDEYNRSGLFGWEREFVDEHVPAGSRIAVAGAGGGREVLALARSGFDVVGFECNEALVSAGNRLLRVDGFSTLLCTVERDRWPAGAGPFDALVVGWGSYMLMPGRAQRIEFLRSARNDLVAAAPVLLSFFARGGFSRRLRLTARCGTAIRRARGRPALEPGDSLAPNYVHWFDRDQIESELRAAGYDLVAFSTTGYGRAVARVR